MLFPIKRMLRIERSSDAGGVRFTISGRIERQHVPELQRLIEDDAAAHRAIVLDLKDTKLVDRDALRFLSQCEANSVALVNCPAYVREWILREGGHGPTTPRK